MRRLLLLITVLLLIAPFAMAESASAEATHAESTAAAHDTAAAADHGGGGEHAPQSYFGIPGWLLKLINMIVFFGLLGWLIKGPVGQAFTTRRQQIRRDAEQAIERRSKADRMAEDIQARLTAIESEVAAIHERALADGERQKKELIAAAEAEAQKILQTARNEVDNRLKHARQELTEFAGTLVAERAETLLRSKVTPDDQKKLFEESLREVGNA